MEAKAPVGPIRNVAEVVFVPPGVPHAIYNTALSDPTFIVVRPPLEHTERQPA